MRKLACARSNKVDEDEPEPSTGGLPECGKSIAIGVLGPGKQRAGANPGRKQRKDQNRRRKRAASDKVVGLGLYPQGAEDRNSEQDGDYDGQNCNLKLGHAGAAFTVVPTGHLPSWSRGLSQCTGWSAWLLTCLTLPSPLVKLTMRGGAAR